MRCLLALMLAALAYTATAQAAPVTLTRDDPTFRAAPAIAANSWDVFVQDFVVWGFAMDPNPGLGLVTSRIFAQLSVRRVDNAPFRLLGLEVESYMFLGMGPPETPHVTLPVLGRVEATQVVGPLVTFDIDALVTSFTVGVGGFAPREQFVVLKSFTVDAPEPASLALVGVAIAGLGLRRRRR